MDEIIIGTIKNILEKFNVNYSRIINIRSKGGVHLHRIQSDTNKYVLKYFENVEFRREINNYLILKKLDILTIPLISYTNEAILMEDIDFCDDMRLAVKEDMDNPNICASLGKWYKNLHEKGKEYIKQHGDVMYMETDCITHENIQIIKQKTGTVDNPIWGLVEENFDYLKELIEKTEKTLTYNDFYYTNMAVSKEHGAFMFDYNLLGKGYVASDIKNVTVQLGKEAKKVFLESYGKYDEKELLMHDVVGILIGLHFACSKKVFPQWGFDELETVNNGVLLENIKKIM